VNRILSDLPTYSLPQESHHGVMLLVNFLREVLPAPWEIYERPFLNGDYPALAVLHPSAGLTIFDVHDWDLRHYRREQLGRYQRYMHRADQKTSSVLNPTRRVEHYIENLLNLYIPLIGESVMRDRRTLSAFRVGVYFPLANTNAVRAFCPLAPGRGVVFGHDAIEAGALSAILPMSMRPSSAPLPNEWLDALRFWLAPPVHMPAPAPPIVLTEEQRPYTLSAPGQHQHLQGVAGSGKTWVLAQRAANLAAAGKRVLVLTFNVTLSQSICQLVNQSTLTFPWTNIEFHHFHGLCKNFLIENSIEWPLVGNRRPNQLWDEMTPELVVNLLQTGHNAKARQYDAILIDEGQDFLPAYYAMLRHFLTEHDELLLVTDPRQNVYLCDDSWLATSVSKLSEQACELATSYRLPPAIAHEANRFAEQFLPAALITPLVIVATHAPNQPAYLAWHNVSTAEQTHALALQAVERLLQDDGIAPADIVILTPNQPAGWAMVRYLAQHDLVATHVLNEGDSQTGRKRERFRKRTFAAHDPRLKVSTIHSFKGWELNHVILLTAEDNPADDLAREPQNAYLFYIAMTRARQTLIVLNRHAAYRAYGAGWSVYNAPTQLATQISG